MTFFDLITARIDAWLPFKIVTIYINFFSTPMIFFYKIVFDK